MAGMAGSRWSKTSHAAAWAVALSLSLSVLDLTVFFSIRRVGDQVQFVDAPRLAAALQIFRPSEHAGLPSPVVAAALAPGRSVRTQPTSCAPLTLLATRSALDAQSWTGVNGSPLQPVRLLTVRYSSASTARAELTAKRVALLRCRRLELTFPPFDGPAQDFTVTDRHWPLSAVGDRVVYELSGAGNQYTFYIRRYANTLTWTYGDDVSTPQVRREVVDELITCLQDMR